MDNPSLVTAIGKLAIAGEPAGFSVEQMIGFLNDGLTVETLLDLISWRLGQSHQGPATSGSHQRGFARHLVRQIGGRRTLLGSGASPHKPEIP